MKQYLDWRKRSGENLRAESLLFMSRSKKYSGRPVSALSKHKLNRRIQEAAKKRELGMITESMEG